MRDIEFSFEKPPIYDKLKEKFGVDWDKGLVVAYDGTIYCKTIISDDLMIHEAMHLKRQEEIGNDEWWNKYFDDPEFRKQEEVLAYKAQIKFLESAISDRNKRAVMKDEIYRTMARLYGGMCTYSEAKELTKL